MCIVHSTLRDAATPYTERYSQLEEPYATEKKIFSHYIILKDISREKSYFTLIEMN